MRATLSFRIPEEQDEFQDALDAHKYRAVLQDLDQLMRSVTKYDAKLDGKDVNHETTILWREKIWELIKEAELHL